MSYAMHAPLGTLDEWSSPSLHTYLPSDVFVLRLDVAGLPLRAAEDLLPIVRAAGRGQNLQFDVRGVAAWQDPGAPADRWRLDVVYTTAMPLFPMAPLIPGFVDDAASMAGKVAADPGLRGAFPAAVVKGQIFGQLTGPADAIDHWRSQPVLWDHALGLGGKPTDSFAKPAEFSLVRGKADDGARAAPWRIGAPPLSAPGGESALWIVGLALAALVGVAIVKGKRKRP